MGILQNTDLKINLRSMYNMDTKLVKLKVAEQTKAQTWVGLFV